MMVDLFLGCGCVVGALPTVRTYTVGDSVFCHYHSRDVSVEHVNAEPEPEVGVDLLHYCPRCGAPWSWHANLGTGDAAEPVCICPHGGLWDECRGFMCKAAL